MTTDLKKMFPDPPIQQRILRGDEVYRLVGLHAVTVWRLRKAGKFPRPVKLGGNSIGWIESDIIDWIASRPHTVY
jgi:prophage regulatory protein